ncbi:MAG: c-type cytochrome domain-containing protein, partial [Bacteroidota bacterium]
FLSTALFFTSCKNDPLEFLPPSGNGTGANSCDPDSAYFENDIAPLLNTNCAKSGCHDPITHAEGIRLNTYANVMNSGIIDPGNPGNSDLIEVITETDPDKIMPPPPAQPLTSSQIALLNQWISQGARNNSCTGGCDTTNVTFSQSIAPLLQNKCNGCHGTSNPGGGVILTSYANVLTVAQNGKLLSSVEHTSAFPMPKNGNKLPQCEIDMIRIWIDAGAPNN